KTMEIWWQVSGERDEEGEEVVGEEDTYGEKEVCRPQPLMSTRRSLTHSSWHTLLTGNSFGMRTGEEMRRLEAMGTYTDDEINRLARGDMFSQFESGGASWSGGCGDEEEGADHQDDKDEDGDGDA
nr:hypothetical protein [Tanacetum cinerariifolium]